VIVEVAAVQEGWIISTINNEVGKSIAATPVTT